MLLSAFFSKDPSQEGAAITVSTTTSSKVEVEVDAAAAAIASAPPISIVVAALVMSGNQAKPRRKQASDEYSRPGDDSIHPLKKHYI